MGVVEYVRIKLLFEGNDVFYFGGKVFDFFGFLSDLESFVELKVKEIKNGWFVMMVMVGLFV